MVGVGRVRPKEKRQIRDEYREAVRFEREQEREQRRFDREMEPHSGAPARTGSQAVAWTGCGCLLLALGGLVLLVMATSEADLALTLVAGFPSLHGSAALGRMLGLRATERMPE